MSPVMIKSFIMAHTALIGSGIPNGPKYEVNLATIWSDKQRIDKKWIVGGKRKGNIERCLPLSPTTWPIWGKRKE